MKHQLSLIFLNYLRLLARLQLFKIKLLNPKLVIVGITGSAGKTSCLLAAEAALKPHFRVKTNYGGNSESGIPLSILGLKISDFKISDWIGVSLLAPLMLLTNWRIYDIFLVEMGIDSASDPKNMSYLLKIVQPDIGIFLNVTPVHLQSFSSLENIAQEKAKLINSVKTAIINSQDPLVKKYSHNANTLPVTPTTIKIPHYVFPKGFDITFGAVLKLAHVLNLPSSEIIKNIQQNFHPAPGRNSLFPGINQSQIIDSSYNSSPLATTEMLNLLKTFPSPRIAVLGDMRELGSASVVEHQKIYTLALKCSDLVITVGQNFTSQNNYKNWRQATDYLLKNLPTKSTILVKGSQNTIFLEELVKQLLANPDDAKKLCRQSPYWLKTKSISR